MPGWRSLGELNSHYMFCSFINECSPHVGTLHNMSFDNMCFTYLH